MASRFRKYRGKRQRQWSRLPNVEALEQRLVMASIWQNPCNPLDVTNDQFVTPIDALVQINRLNSVGSGDLPNPPPAGDPPPYYDPSGDEKLVPLDVLLVI